MRGDRLVLLTAGMLERNAENVNMNKLLSELVTLHPREAVQALTAAVVPASQAELRDDATVLILDWYGSRTQTRDASSGATNDRASH